MANAAIASQNLADAGRLNCSSAATLLPVSNLQTPHLAERWRSNSAADFVVLDLLTAQTLDTVMLRGLTVSASATLRVRISSSDSSGAAGDLADSGTVASGAAAFDATYGGLVYLLAAPVNGRYLRIDISDPAAAYVEAGRLFVGLRTALTYNFGYGWQVQYVDRSLKAKTRGGQTLIFKDSSYRTLDFSIGLVTATQRYGLIETIDRVNGTHLDILVITDPASSNLARDSIFGLVSDITPVIQPSAVFDSDGAMFSKQFKVEERL